MASFNPFDDYLSAPTTAPTQLPPQQHVLTPQHLNVPSRPEPIATMPSNDDYGGFFDSPVSNKNNQSFSDLRQEDGADDWSGFSTTEAVDDWSAFSPQKQTLKKTGSSLSPRVFAAAKRSSKRRSTNPFSPRSMSGTSPPPQPPPPPTHAPTSPTPSTISFQKKGTPRSTSADNHDANVDTSKNNKIYRILDKISTFSKHSSNAAQQSVALAYAELEVFVSNPQYRHCDQAIDGLLGVYTTLKQMEHDCGTMDPRLVKAYENLKKLAMQLGGQQALIFQRCQTICENIRGQPVPHDPYGASSPRRKGTPKKGSVLELETQFGLGSSHVMTTIQDMCRGNKGNGGQGGKGGGYGRARTESSTGDCVLQDKQLSGMLSLRQTNGVKFMRKWTDAFFVLNNERLVVFKDSTVDIRRAKPIMDVKLHGKMQITGFKPYPSKKGVIMSCKYQELDQTLGEQGNVWKTIFKFGSRDKSKFELIKFALNSVVTFQRKKDPTLAVKRSFSFGAR